MKYVETFKPIINAIYKTSKHPTRKGIWSFINNQINNTIVRHAMNEVQSPVYSVIPSNIYSVVSGFISDSVEEINK